MNARNLSDVTSVGPGRGKSDYRRDVDVEPSVKAELRYSKKGYDIQAPVNTRQQKNSDGVKSK